MLLNIYLGLLYLALAAVGLLFLQQGYWPITLLLWGGNALPGAGLAYGARCVKRTRTCLSLQQRPTRAGSHRPNHRLDRPQAPR